MKEYKYRLIREGKTVGWEWHTKNRESGNVEIMHSDNGKDWFRINNTEADLCIKSPCILMSIPHDDKEPFTGFKIKGKEIYGGDKLHSNYYGTLIVKWDRDGKWIGKNKHDSSETDLYRAIEKCELIGNIHE